MYVFIVIIIIVRVNFFFFFFCRKQVGQSLNDDVILVYELEIVLMTNKVICSLNS